MWARQASRRQAQLFALLALPDGIQPRLSRLNAAHAQWASFRTRMVQPLARAVLRVLTRRRRALQVAPFAVLEGIQPNQEQLNVAHVQRVVRRRLERIHAQTF